ncbi:MAG TPA: hypothetical protein VER08_04260, partial [Pyrinomonadaceae bacterium]|nr:hypothetical protein [Pyrinomonadaceae bacterium]
TLLPEGAYSFYLEERAVGRQGRQGGLFELLKPVFELAPMPGQTRQFLEFFNSHGEALDDARLFVAFAPSQSSLPAVLTVVELPSVEAAEKFAPAYDKHLAALTERSEGDADAPGATEGATERRPSVSLSNVAISVSEGQIPKMHVRRVGRLVFASDTQFKLQTLRPKGARPLSSDPRFKAARSRFASEPVFAFVDFAAFSGVIRREMAAAEARRQEAEEEARRREAETLAADPAPQEEATADANAGGVQELTPAEVEEMRRMEAATARLSGVPTDAGVGDTEELGPGAEGEAEAGSNVEAVAEEPDLFMLLWPLVFGGREQGFMESLPKALGAAVSPEGDTLALRLMLFNDEDRKGSFIPFLPSLVAGPGLAPEGAGVARSDTAVLVTLSLDLALMYERLLETAARFEEELAGGPGEPPPPAAEAPPPAGPGTPTLTRRADADTGPLARLRAAEKIFNFKIKEDLIDSLGNEITVSLPQQWFRGASPPPAPAPEAEGPKPAGQTAANAPSASATPPPPVQRNFVVIIPVRDKAKLEGIFPRVLRAFSFVRPKESPPVLKQGGTEVFTFGSLSFAFVGNNLVAAPDAESVRSVIAAHTDGQTLVGVPDFRAATRWQPRQVIGQLYVSGNLLKGVFTEAREMVERETDPATRLFLPHLNGEPGSVTLAASGEADGPLHELRVPVNLLAMFAALGAAEEKLAPVRSAESRAVVALQSVHHAQTNFRETKENSRFGTLEELVAAGITYGGLFEMPGYKFEMTVNGDKYVATATPTDYPRGGRRSFFIDETGVLRGGDKGGRPASADDGQVTY